MNIKSAEVTETDSVAKDLEKDFQDMAGEVYGNFFNLLAGQCA